MKNLIISSAYSYSPRDISLFLKSTYKNVPESKVLLFVSPEQKAKSNEYKHYNPNSELESIDDEPLRTFFWKTKYHRIIGRLYLHAFLKFAVKLNLLKKQSHINAVYHISVSRYFYSLQYLLKYRQDYSNVLLCDSRDVLLCGDPFENIGNRLISGIENKRIDECQLNQLWLRKVFGKDDQFRLRTYPIICSGVTYGKIEVVLRYLKTICKQILIYLDRTAFRFGLDQAHHNFIIRNKLNRLFKLVSNGDHSLATLGLSDLSEFIFKPDVGLLTKNGQEIKILHQYDRHPELLKWAKDKYDFRHC